MTERDTKSIGAEETFATDLHTAAACERELVRLADRACARLRGAGLTARTINLKIRFANFETRTRARTLPEATDISTTVFDVARALVGEFDVARGVRLLGVSLSGLDSGTETQATLDLDLGSGSTGADGPERRARTDRRAAVERAMDEVRDRFGTRAVGPATLVEKGRE